MTRELGTVTYHGKQGQEVSHAVLKRSRSGELLACSENSSMKFKTWLKIVRHLHEELGTDAPATTPTTTRTTTPATTPSTTPATEIHPPPRWWPTKQATRHVIERSMQRAMQRASCPVRRIGMQANTQVLNTTQTMKTS
jgi:hypothetical protein